MTNEEIRLASISDIILWAKHMGYEDCEIHTHYDTVGVVASVVHGDDESEIASGYGDTEEQAMSNLRRAVKWLLMQD